MYTEKSVVKCESGLHNRQATFFIQKANEFRSSIWIEVDDRKINAKSLLGVLSMAITTGTEVTLIAEGRTRKRQSRRWRRCSSRIFSDPLNMNGCPKRTESAAFGAAFSSEWSKHDP